ncbi:uncharacterized protein LOC131156262 isoform X1 [Malania oleifera]|uniref:uncharacterized protein LOC131156262 isoform X1 n=2 Tax=Malania oleifera TaxID=397392 RepID=UPI0025ADD48F|nr:uncharacterized protein LOC131156262 isoform X1 [Malania oleifera]
MDAHGGAVGGGNFQQRLLSDHMLAVDAINLRELLKVSDDDLEVERGRTADQPRNAAARITLGAVLSIDKTHGAVSVSQTLHDIIRDESSNPAPYGDPLAQNANNANKKNWKSFKDRLRLRRVGAAWTSSVHIPTSDVPIRDSRANITGRHSTRYQEMAVDSGESIDESDHHENSSASAIAPAQNSRAGQISRMSSTRFSAVTFNLEGLPPPRDNIGDESESAPRATGTRLGAALAAEREQQGEAAGERRSTDAAEGDGEGAAPVRMSLMALLEETDRQMGVVGPAYCAAYDEEEEEEEDEEEGGGNDGGRRGGGEQSCCVCMVRHKGAAFIPCGHTFCRLCSRELWVSRGNCPICNGFILEILDIF